MRPFLYRCPVTGLKIQGIAPDDEVERDMTIPVNCPACGRIHFVKPKSDPTTVDDGK